MMKFTRREVIAAAAATTLAGLTERALAAAGGKDEIDAVLTTWCGSGHVAKWRKRTFVHDEHIPGRVRKSIDLDLHIVSSAIMIVGGVQGLMHIAHEVQDEFERHQSRYQKYEISPRHEPAPRRYTVRGSGSQAHWSSP